MGIFSGARSKPASEDDDQPLDDRYESAFTYNTEREYVNIYPAANGAYNHYGGDDTRDTSAQWPSRNEEPRAISTRLTEWLLLGLSALLLTLTFPVTLFFCMKFVPAYERLVVFRLGRAHRTRGAGTVIMLPLVERAIRVDMRAHSVELSPLQFITADRGIVEAAAAVRVQVADALRVVCSLQDREQALRNMAHTTLTNALVRLSVGDINHARTRAQTLVKVAETLRAFFAPRGADVVDVSLVNVKVLKAGENQTIGLFQQLLSSELGKTVLSAFGSHAAEFLAANPPRATDGADAAAAFHATFAEATGVGTPSATDAAAAAQTEEASRASPPAAEIETLVAALARCCDASLVARVGKAYRVVCSLRGRSYTLALDLAASDGACRLLSSDSDESSASASVDVTFELTYATLMQLIRGDTSPLSAYLSGDVRVSGRIEDAMALSHLASRVKELKITLL